MTNSLLRQTVSRPKTEGPTLTRRGWGTPTFLPPVRGVELAFAEFAGTGQP